MDNRRHPRTQCFQMAHDHDLTPVWVFRRATPDGVLGLVVDFSDSGLKALVEKHESLDAEFFIVFIGEQFEGPDPRPSFTVARKWTGVPMGLYDLCGFEFTDPAEAQDCVQFMKNQLGSGNAWIRCELLAWPPRTAPEPLTGP